MADDVTVHGNTVRPDRMELLTTSDRVPERLRRLESAIASGGGSAAGTIENWITPNLLNGWQHYGAPFGPVQYRKRPDGLVEIRGLCTAGSYGTAIFNLPAGYRPVGRTIIFPGENQTTSVGDMRVSEDGNVAIQSGVAGGWNSLACMFSTGQSAFPAGPPGSSGPTGLQGPQGVKGDTGNTGPIGPQGVMEVYQQPATPPTNNIGAVWIDTDEVPSSTQNLVPTGPAGGALAGDYPNPTLARRVGDFVDFRSTGPQAGSGVTVNSGSWVDSGVAARQIVYTTPAYLTRGRITYKSRWDRAGSGWGWGSGGLNISPAPVMDYDGVYATTPPGCARNIMIGESPTVLYFTPEGTFFVDLAASTTYTLSHAFYASSPWRMDNSMALASIALEVFVR